MDLKKLTEKEISNMTLTELVGFTDELNKPSGGIKTLNKIILNAHINSSTKFLEIGCTTGFSSIEIKRLTNADVYGIDIDKNSLEKAKARSLAEGLKINFMLADATKLPFKDNSFDVVFCSNVTSFIKDKEAALFNYKRVLKTYGFLVAVPIYYLKRPPKELLNKVSKEVGNKIEYFTKQDWLNFFEDKTLELFYYEDFKYKIRTLKEIKEYVEQNYMKKPEVLKLPDNLKLAVYNKYVSQLSIFNENLSYAGSSILIYRKVPETYEKELFPSVYD